MRSLSTNLSKAMLKLRGEKMAAGGLPGGASREDDRRGPRPSVKRLQQHGEGRACKAGLR